MANACFQSVPRARGPLARLHSLAAAGLGLIAMGLGGCEGVPSREPPPPVNTETAQSKFKFSDDDFAKLGYRRDWTGYPGASRNQEFLFVNCYDDLVILQDSTSTVMAIEVGTGARRWANTLANPLTNFVGVVRIDDEIYSSSESEVFALKLSTGELVGRQDLSKTVSTHPVLVGHTLVFGTPSGQLLAHYLAQNVALWGNTTEGSVVRDPVMVGSAIGAISQTGRVIFVDGTTGTLLGRSQMYDGADCEVAASDSLMFVASRDHSLYAFSPVGTRPVWRKRTGSPLKWSPVFNGGTVWCALPEEGLTAFYADSGSIRWSAEGMDGEVIAMRAGKLVVWNGEKAFLVEPERGEVYETIETPGIDRLVTDRFVDGNLYAVSNLGVIVRLVPRS
jgi:outer membrane protein assembly factor BamB